jgi:predicted TIM-barrel fold metal-dependent hydrolase
VRGLRDGPAPFEEETALRTIDTEHHFSTPLFMETLRTNQNAPRLVEGKGLAYWEDAIIPIGKTGAGPKLADMGEGRIKAMDEAGVDFAILSLAAPGVEPLEPSTATKVARDSNDRLAEYVAAYPDRLAGMATLSVKEPAAAVGELSGASRSWASRAGTLTPTSATRIWMRSATGRCWKRPRRSTRPCTCIPPRR